jgi:hypothetical protein
MSSAARPYRGLVDFANPIYQPLQENRDPVTGATISNHPAPLWLAPGRTRWNAERRGLKRNTWVMQDLPHLSELHKLHYARYPQIEARPVALIGQFDDMTDNLLAHVAPAIGS